jgi:hypothetical protein
MLWQLSKPWSPRGAAISLAAPLEEQEPPNSRVILVVLNQELWRAVF